MIATISLAHYVYKSLVDLASLISPSFEQPLSPLLANLLFTISRPRLDNLSLLTVVSLDHSRTPAKTVPTAELSSTTITLEGLERLDKC